MIFEKGYGSNENKIRLAEKNKTRGKNYFSLTKIKSNTKDGKSIF